MKVRATFLFPIVASAALAGAAAAADDLVRYEVVDRISIPASLTDEPGDPALGREAAVGRQLGHCLACHEIPALGGEPLHGTVGPSLAGVATRYTEGELRLRVVDPKAIDPETIMPAYYKRDGLHRVAKEFQGTTILTAQQVEDVVAFLLTLQDDAPLPDAARREDALGRLERVAVAAPDGSPYPWLFSGYHVKGESVRAIEDDPAANPGSFTVGRGAELWTRAEGAANRACADCHGKAEESMTSAGARYPVYHEPSGKPITLEERVNLCRTEQMEAEAWAWGSDELVAMTTFVRHQARGQPVHVTVDGAARPFFERGRQHYYQRRGLFDMSCAQCHEQNYGRWLRGNLLSQGQTNAHPLYHSGGQDMEWLHDLFALCNGRVRAEPYAPGSDEFVALELYVAWRGNGLPVETPGVR